MLMTGGHLKIKQHQSQELLKELKISGGKTILQTLITITMLSSVGKIWRLVITFLRI